MNDYINWQVIGLTLNIVGAFFIVNSLIFKRPLRALQEHFGVEKRRSLSSIRSHVMSQVQLVIGFIFLISGYFLSLAAHLADEVPDRENFFSDPTVLSIAAILISSMLVVTLVLKVGQIFWTKWTFRRLLIDFFRDNASLLEKDAETLKELGQLMDVEKKGEDSVTDYKDRVKKALEIHTPTPRTDRNSELSSSAIRAARPTPPPEPMRAPPHPATPPRVGS